MSPLQWAKRLGRSRRVSGTHFPNQWKSVTHDLHTQKFRDRKGSVAVNAIELRISESLKTEVITGFRGSYPNSAANVISIVSYPKVGKLLIISFVPKRS